MDSMNAIVERRSIRRFLDKPIEHTILARLVDAARLYPSAGNIQPLRFAVVTNEMHLDEIFGCLNWAMYIPGFHIAVSERPKAYIILLSDDNVKRNCMFDVGAAASYVMIGAKEFSLDSCCLGIAKPKDLAEKLSIPEGYTPVVAIALGYAGQRSTVISLKDTVKYSETTSGDMQVPKRDIGDILVYSDLCCGA